MTTIEIINEINQEIYDNKIKLSKLKWFNVIKKFKIKSDIKFNNKIKTNILNNE